MQTVWFFLADSALLGLGLAADAFSLSVANGIRCPGMKLSHAAQIAGLFALFQALMPMLGWLLTQSLLGCFQWLQRILPWLAPLFLCGLGVKMLLESRSGAPAVCSAAGLSLPVLLLQAVATSIDALLAGLALAQYRCPAALLCSGIIAAVTFVLCLCGVRWGRLLGLRLAGKAAALGGVLLLLIAGKHILQLLR